MLAPVKKGLTIIAEQTGIGKRILKGIREAKVDMQFEFHGLPSGNSKMLDLYKSSFGMKAPSAVRHILNDKEFKTILSRYVSKNNFTEAIPKNLSLEEITMLMLQKAGVGPAKFAQIISSDAEVMSRFSPRLQEVIKRTQSENPFSRTLTEAQDIVNRAFAPRQKAIGTIKEGSLVKSEIELVKPLSAGTVGEAYLAKTADGKEIIVKMIKKNIDAEQLEMEEQIYTRLIHEFAPNEATAETQIKMLHNLYKDWNKELNFTQEFTYNKQLQKGAKRFKVADITRISEDGSCILMEKAEGIQMNTLLKMLQDYKSNPEVFFTKYAKDIEQYEWLRNPEQVIEELPKSITRAFDEQFMFMKEGGTSIMHGDPHMGNYFITSENGVLKPVYIDTGNCVLRNKEQIASDLSFLANYFVGNSRGLAKYFIQQCKNNNEIMLKSNKLIRGGNQEEALITSLAADIQEQVFNQRANITDVDKITKTMQTILENFGLTINPESATALKAQMQFYTGINETAALSGKTIDVATIIKDMPHALMSMLKHSVNPVTVIKDAVKHSYNNQTQASNCIYQFLAPKCDMRMTLSYANPSNYTEVPLLAPALEKSIAVV